MYDPTKMYLADNRYSSVTALYRYFNMAGELLYIGITNDFWKRDLQHLQSSPWRLDASHAHLEAYPTRRLAEAAEEAAIFAEKPMGNTKVRPVGEFYSYPEMWYVDKMGGVIGESPTWLAVYGMAGGAFWRSPMECECPFPEMEIRHWAVVGEAPEGAVVWRKGDNRKPEPW